MDVEVLAMSTDSRFTHKIWQDEELSKMVPGGVPFPMLSDAGGRIGQVYGVYQGNGSATPEDVEDIGDPLSPKPGHEFEA
ncbi:MAG: redoxin domain-containing protein [Deltaproteobacteria bacterium]